MENLLNFGRKIIPRRVFEFFQPAYHYILAFLAALFYGFPSRKMKVIGVTGTKGKSSTVYFLSKIFEEAGHKTAAISSIQFKIDNKEWPNNLKMTMPGRFTIQSFLSKAVKAGCEFAILEVSSQGVLQHRHQFINFDTAVFTNLAPEHIEAHGSFENYKGYKLKFFKYANNNHILNKNDKYFADFSSVPAKNKQIYSTDSYADIKMNLLGDFNFSNAAAAIKTAELYGVASETAKQALENIRSLPGRMEVIDCPNGESRKFKVIVDYAHTPDSMEAVYRSLKPKLANGAKLICVFGATGGGRDKWKRPEYGKISEKYCDEIILTNEDPYDENPASILQKIEAGFSSVESVKSKVRKVIDRKEAIKTGISLAKEGDIVIITGKGSESVMMLADGKKVHFDDREAAREALMSL
ncbi:UDP-N-acetylmuramoyl-L-alanyl-D-glutamate--2,6-diaminopimelate ligase [Candidatus Parcubacteria bacterium]|nr:MAG: UDP-N-acetylmuramoyl-L-alanyl-D-glutamate--2,6-diaminopimelate ligase [Candidatus Parcubacteria bacterium]